MSYLGFFKKGKGKASEGFDTLWPYASLLVPIGLSGGRQALRYLQGQQSFLLAILGGAGVWAITSPSLSLKIQSSSCLKFHLLLSQVVVDTPRGWYGGPGAAAGGRQAQNMFPFTGNNTGLFVTVDQCAVCSDE